VHPEYSIVDSLTGRSTAYNPAAQTWPKAKEIRALVKSRFPGGKIIEVDEATFELRMLASCRKIRC
jgi:hypothetical protein